MSKEFEIVSKINLDTDEAMSKWQKFKTEANEMKDIDLKIKISNLSVVEKELKNLISLSEKLSKTKGKSNSLGVSNNNMKEEIEYLNKYKDIYRTIQKLQQQQSKTTNKSSFNRLGEDIDKLQSKLKEFEGKIKSSDMKLELFQFKQNNADIVNFERSLTNLSSKAEKLQKDFNSIDFKNVNTSALEGDINQLLSRIEQLQVMGRSGIDVTIDLNNAIGEVERLKSVLLNFTELDSLKSKFSSLEGDIADALGAEAVDKLRNEMTQLESSVMQVDGSFDRLSSGMKSNLNTAASSVKKMNSELKSAGKFTSDFMGSFYAYTAGNVIGDGIVRGIRGMKDAYLEVDKAMTNVKKVADETDINTSAKLDNIRDKGIEIAKSVGQSSADTLNAIADTVQAGVSKTLEGSMEIAKQAMQFANVGELSQEISSSMVNTMIRGFKIDPVTKFQKEINGATQEVTGLTMGMDALNYASNKYGTSAEHLSNAIQNGGNVLGSYGVSLNDTVGLITAGVEVLGDGNKVGNGLKSIAINLAGIKASADTGELSLNKTAKTLKQVAGIDVYSDKKNGQIKDMVTILDELKGKWSDLTEEQQRGLSEAVAGKQQSAVFQAILSNYDQFKKLQGELSQDMHLGSMEAENSRYVDSISGKLNQLKQTWTSIGTTMVSSDFTKGLLDGAIKISEAIEKVIKSLDKVKMLTPVMTGLTLSFASMMKSISGGRGASFGVLTSLNKDLNKSKGLMGNIKQIGSNAFATVGSSISSAGKYMASFLTQGLAIAGVTMAIQALAKAWDNATNGLKNAEKEIRTSIENINAEINSDTESLNYLNSTSDRYDELIKKKKEYSNIPIESMTSEQIADMEELRGITSELAQMFPELVIGYDSNGSPILMMADDMEQLKKRTQDQIDLNKELLKMERQKLADNAREQVQKGDLLGSSTKLDVARDESNLRNSYARKKALENEYINAVKDGNEFLSNKKAKELQKQENKIKEFYDRSLKSYQDYSQKELTIQQATFDQVQAMKGYDKLEGDNLSNIQGFIDNLNWANLDEGQYNKWVNSFDKVIDLANSGSPKLKEWNDSLEVAKDKYAATGNIKEYTQSLDGLAKTISEDLNLDYETVFSGLENMVKPLTESEKKMNSFLESFGKTRYDLLNGDDVAMQLAEQFQAVDDVVNTMLLNKDYAFKANGSLTFDMMTDIANKDEIPDQIQSLANELAKGGVTKAESDLMLEIMMAINSGDKAEVESAIENVNSKLKEMGMEEHTIDIKTLFDETGVDNATSKVSELEKALDSFRQDKSMKLMIDLVGEDKAKLYSEIIENLPVNAEFTNKFIVENEEALSKMKTYQEVVDYINGLPDEVQKTYGFNVNGAEETKQKATDTKNAVDELDETDAEVEIDADTSDAEDGIDKVNEKKKELEEPANLTVNNGELQGSVEEFSKLIEYSTKLKDGEYQISFKSDTADAIAQIDNLKLAVNNLSNQFREIPSTTITLNTALAAQNLSGLINRIEQTKSALGTLSSKNVNINTAQSAKNLSGLITRVQQYSSAINGITDKTLNCHTAQAAKNISGLIAKIGEYNRTNAKTLTFKTNASAIATQINTLSNAVRNVPNGKTINYSIKTTGSVPKLPGTRSISPLVDTNSDIQARTLEMQRSVSGIHIPTTFDSPNEIDISNDMPSVFSWNNPLETHKYGLNQFIELENQLKKIANQLAIIDEKAKNAFGQEKINYLNQQNNLLKQQQKLQEQLASEMQNQQQALKNMLSGKGIRFDGDGNISNYHDKLVAMNKELDRLEEASKKASENSSNYKGDNEGERDRLSNESKAASDRLSKYKDDYDELKKAMDEYLNLTFNDIPGAKEEWEKLNNEIKDTTDSLEELNRQQRLFEHQNKVKELEYEYDKIADRLDIIDSKMKHAYGTDKLKLIDEQIALLKQQQDLQNQLINSYRQQASVYRDDLSNYGFTFDNNGDITNIDETLNKFKNHKDLEKVKKLVEEYIKIQRDELPDATKEWEKLNSEIKDAYKEQLNVTKDIEDQITDVYKKQVEKRKKLIDEELDKRLKALDKQKEAYNKVRDEQDYKKDYDKQLSAIEDIQKKIDIASKDTSISGQKRLQELLKQLADEQEKLQDMVQDKIDESVNDMFDSEKDRLEQEAEKEKDRLDKEFSDERIQELVKSALSTGVFEDIDGTMRSLQDVMLKFVDEYGDGLSAIGDLIKNEMISNLEIAKDTMRDLADIMSELNLKSFSNVGRMAIPDTSRSVPNQSNSYNNSVQFNSPLMVVEGNVTPDVMPDLKNAMKQLEKSITNNIVKKMNG